MNRHSLRTALLLLPGKLSTFIGPLLLFQILPAADYAAFEAVLVAASILAIVLAAGRPTLLPYQYLELGREDALSALRARLNPFCVSLLALSAAAALVPVNLSPRWQACVLLLPTMVACFLAQTFVAVAWKVRGRLGCSAFAEHGIWTCVVVLTVVAWTVDLAPGLNVLNLLAWGYTALLVLLAQWVLRAHLPSAATVVPCDEARDKTAGLSLMIAQLSLVGGLSVARVVFLAIGQPESSARSALAFRLALPVIFMSQVGLNAGLRELFSPAVTRKAAATERALLGIGVASLILLPLLLIGNALAPHPLFPRDRAFTAALVLAVGITAVLVARDVAGTAAVGCEGRMKRAASLTAALMCTAPLMAGIAWGANLNGNHALALVGGLFVCWVVFALVVQRQVSPLLPSRALGWCWAYTGCITLLSGYFYLNGGQM